MNPDRRGSAPWRAGLLVALATTAVLLAIAEESRESSPPPVAGSVAVREATDGVNRHGVVIVGARSAPGIATGEIDRLGEPVLANCTTCHATRAPNAATSDGAQLRDFHMGLAAAHGGLQCVACHNPANYSQLRLASGEGIEFADSLRLCAQCHGPQFRDYQNGVHGGMTGYWDLARGPRVRNHCLACHDAHAPQYQPVTPVFAPRDGVSRVLVQEDRP